MQKEQLPIYQIQDFKAHAQREHYFYFSTFSTHLQEHLFIREPHKHDFYIVLIVTQGSGTHTIDFKEYVVKPNSIFFMAPGQVHSWRLSEDVDGFVIFFTKEFYAKEYPQRKLYDLPFFNVFLHRPVLYIAPEEKQVLLQTLHVLMDEHQNQKLMREIMLSRYLDILLILMMRIYQARGMETEVAGREQALLQNLERLIDQHYKEHVPVSFYADKLHVTTKHLNETCKKSLGRTTKELIQFRTVLEAKRLLVHSELTTSQIAAELGYSDNAYFFRFFKKHNTCTPEQFRTQISNYTH